MSGGTGPASSSIEAAAPGLAEFGSRRRARKNMKLHVPALLTLCFVVGACSAQPRSRLRPAPSAAAPLTSWNQGAARSGIVDFVMNGKTGDEPMTDA